jgi:hypothetical protein
MTDSRCEINAYGTKRWYNEKGQFHRLDGPAVEYADGFKLWYVNDKCHRLDGPAREWSYGRCEWWIDNEPLFSEQFERHPLVIFYRLSKFNG